MAVKYNTQQLIDQYYQWQYCPFLKQDKNTCLTEPYYQTIFSIIKPYLQPSTTVLDIGCGLGRVVFDIAKEPIKNAVGIDRSERFIAECNKIAQDQSTQLHYPYRLSSLSFQVADALNLPFQPSDFNLVICLNVIDRIPKPKQLIKEIEKVLESGGLLLIADPYDWQEAYTAPSEYVENMFDLFNKTLWSKLTEIDKLPYTLHLSERKTISYKSHLLLLKKT